MSGLRILFISDIVGKPGRDLTRRAIPALVDRHDVDLVVANVENAAGGRGVTREIGEALRAAGVDVMTSGNHIWDRRETLDYITLEPRLLRPANYPPGAPGSGQVVVTTRHGDRVGVLNLMGRVFMADLDNPFAVAGREVERLRAETPLILVDFHAEATSEKQAMGWHLDGRVTAVIGTHTHVPTADEQILPGGTAYITDAGMTGPHDSVIGVEKEAALARFLTGMPVRYETASGNPRLNAVLITADAASGRARGIERVSLSLEDLKAPADGAAYAR